MSGPRILSIGKTRIFRAGYEHIRSNDSRLAPVLDRHGLIKFRPRGDIFESLVESILSQQISGAAADAIIGRVRALYPGGKLDAELIYRTEPSSLRHAGVSPQKLGYLRDFSERVASGSIRPEALRLRSDEEIIRILDGVKGVGPWTVHMLLIFTLGRPNVLPIDDLGIKRGIQSIYGLSSVPTRRDIEEIANNWNPYCSVASLYVWRHKDVKIPLSLDLT